MISIDHFEKAIESLRNALEIYDSGVIPMGTRQEELMRDGVIQRFEYTFELAWKTLKRFLEEYSLEKVDALTNKDFFRVGFEQGYLRDSEAWLDYLRKRNLTSHVYDEKVARKVYETAHGFLADVQFLAEKMNAKLHA